MEHTLFLLYCYISHKIPPTFAHPRKIVPIYIGTILCRVRKISPIYMGTILRMVRNISPIYIGTILYRVHKISPIYIGLPFCVGVRYFTAPIPMYIGVILRTPTQNYSYIYIYRNTMLISVNLYITYCTIPLLFDNFKFGSCLFS